MKNLLIFTILIILASCASREEVSTSDSRTNVFAKELYPKQVEATHLAMYDALAWGTSDTLSKYEMKNLEGKLGAEWFGYTMGEDWIFTYGKFENGKYFSGVRYKISNGKTVKINKGNDSLEQMYGKMLNQVLDSGIQKFYDKGVKPNWIVYNDTLSKQQKVWLLPSVTQNWEIIYGYEIEYVFNATGDSHLKTYERGGNLMYHLPDESKNAEVVTDEKLDLPTVGDLYFVERWGHLFKSAIAIGKKLDVTQLKSKNQKSWFSIAK